MQRSSVMLLALAVMSAPAVTSFAQAPVAQNAYLLSAGASAATQPEAAPIERQNPAGSNAATQNGSTPQHQGPHIVTSQPANGVTVRTDQPTALHTVSSDATRTELKLDHGRANIIVHGPAPDTLLLVDLPGGQTQLLKDGFYTFNANTNTVRVLSGEADAFASTSNKPVKVKEDDSLVFNGSQAKLSQANAYNSRQDILQGGMHAGSGEHGYGASPAYGYAGYGPGPYAYGGWDGYYGDPYGYYPYYAFGGPYFGGYPFGFGFGYGFGSYGFGGGYYRGAYGYRGAGGRGFGGGGFHGGGGGGHR